MWVEGQLSKQDSLLLDHTNIDAWQMRLNWTIEVLTECTASQSNKNV